MCNAHKKRHKTPKQIKKCCISLHFVESLSQKMSCDGNVPYCSVNPKQKHLDLDHT